MKTSIYLTLMSCLLLGCITSHAQTYSVKVGGEQYLPVPSVSKGYVDHTVWACSSPSIQFVNKDNTGATIKVVSDIDGTAIVELVYVSKYVDENGWTRSYTLQHNYYITSSSGDISGSKISIPQEIQVYVNGSVTIQPTLLPSGAPLKQMDISVSPSGYAGAAPLSDMSIIVRGMKVGKCVLTISSGSLTATSNISVVDVPGTESHEPMISTLTKENTFTRLKDIIEKTGND